MHSRANSWIILPLLVCTSPAFAEEDFSKGFTEGKAILDARYR